MYHLIKARVQKKMGHPEESVNTMHAAMNLPGVKKAGTAVALVKCPKLLETFSNLPPNRIVNVLALSNVLATSK